MVSLDVLVRSHPSLSLSLSLSLSVFLDAIIIFVALCNIHTYIHTDGVESLWIDEFGTNKWGW
jgi:hypothetical protein